MDAILCPQCNHENPIEATVCEHCNADLSPVKSIVDTANSHYNQALFLAHEGRLDEALGQLDAAISLSSQNPIYYNLLGTIQAQKGLFSEAIRAWEKCIALNPEMEKAFFNIDKARRMEEVRAEELEQRPQWLLSVIAGVAACLFFFTTLMIGINSYQKSKKINLLTNDMATLTKEASSWKSQFESLTAQFPSEGINGVLKKLTQNETLIADRDKRIADLEERNQRASDNYRDRIAEFRETSKTLQQEKTELEQKVKTIDDLQTLIVQQETQIETLQESVNALKESVNVAYQRSETHKSNLLVAQENVRDLQVSRETALENARKTHEKEIQEIRAQILELRDEIASRERTEKDRAYADQLIAEALQNLENNEFSLALQNINTALERYPLNPAAIHLQEKTSQIMDNPLEQEIRRLEKTERETKRTGLKAGLITRNLEQAQKYYSTGRYVEAVELARLTLSLHPDNTKQNEALKEIIVKSDENNKEIVLLLLQARKEIDAQNYKEADLKLKQIIKRSPTNPEANELLKQIVQ